MRSPTHATKLAILQACLNALPARQHAVVAGSPDDEGNSVETVRALAGRLPVYWLVAGDPESLRWMVSGLRDQARVHCLHKQTLRAYWAYVTARWVFFTHGLYGSLHPPRHKTFVNLWHGDGPKRRKGHATVRSTFVVSGTKLWGQQRARSFGVDEGRVLVTGNPRVDQFARPASDDALRALGIDPASRLVLWLPTYRTTRYRGIRLGRVRNWSDAGNLSSSDDVTETLAQAAAGARSLGVTLAVKPHNLDADGYHVAGLHVVTNADLGDAQIGLYQLLARADGLVTDYSSVWTDFLALDRPIGFYCPDYGDYVANRGLNVDDYPSLLPGPLLDSPADVRRFLQHCRDDPESSRARRQEVVARVGAQTRLGATQRLLDELGVCASSDRLQHGRGRDRQPS